MFEKGKDRSFFFFFVLYIFFFFFLKFSNYYNDNVDDNKASQFEFVYRTKTVNRVRMIMLTTERDGGGALLIPPPPNIIPKQSPPPSLLPLDPELEELWSPGYVLLCLLSLHNRNGTKFQLELWNIKSKIMPRMHQVDQLHRLIYRTALGHIISTGQLLREKGKQINKAFQIMV